MEVRCKKCNKLFRVSDDKITGTGIKFPCTRCGEYVRITREDFEHYTLSRNAEAVPDLFELKPKPAESPLWPETATAPSEHESPTLNLAAQATRENVSEEKPPLFVEPDHLTPASAAKTESFIERMPESLTEAKPKDEPLAEPQPEQRPEPEPSPPVQPAVPKKEYTRPAAPPISPVAERIVIEPIHPSKRSPSGFMVLLVTLIIAGLVACGIYFYLQSSPTPRQKEKEAVHEMTSIEGLQIVNPAGSMDANGDLLISGVIENATVKEKTSWYVLAVVNDAQGSELAKIRILNGKQIYTRRDYDILAGRGVNVQELKTKDLQEKGVVIPPMGSVKFEVRYLQPAPGIASFHTQVLPVDPVQLNKEIAAELN
jgi:predicted Zn finger-like uncharacterized protein